jgi:hypothetical protein
MRSTVLLSLLLLSSACRTDDKPGDSDPPVEDTGPGVQDADADGYPAGEDCDDDDASIHPGAEEICDGIDNDCDDEVDEGMLSTWYADGDGDGWGDDGAPTEACDAPSGAVERPGDCDDGNAESHPEAPERCNGLDDDCDDLIDEDLQEIWYRDGDGDGYGDADSSLESCDPGPGWVDDNLDCDDGDAEIRPGVEERCNDRDDDCDGAVDEGLERAWYQDADGDGHGDPEEERVDCEPGTGWVTAAEADDCDDANSDIFPGADELCDTVDNDCDGTVDEDDAIDASTWHRDGDGDGYGDPTSTTLACAQPSGYLEDATDCDDGDDDVHPGADEPCDGADNDCDGDVDEGHDSDSDGIADCYDSEECDGLDNDGDGLVDDDDPDVTGGDSWYADADGDGYGNPAFATTACGQPSGWVADDADCDDTAAGSNPGASERCDGVDNDCDGITDEADAVDAPGWYLDGDGDGWGAGVATTACSQPSGSVTDAGDCDDGDSGVYPGAEERCDGVDQDCDGDIDEDPVDGDAWYADVDLDGYGDPDSERMACSQPSGWVADSSDCEDGDATAYPGSTATEVPYDGVDQDCDGLDVCTDLNCDGVPDLLFPSYRSDSSWYTQSRVYYGTGAGFASSHGLTLDGIGPLDALVEDLDGDGYPDIVLGAYYDGSTQLVDSYVYWGSASGYSSGDRSDLGTEGVIAVRASDLDHDGYTDLVFASHYGTSYASTSMVYWGSASGFSDSDRTELATYGSYDLAIADLDDDGYEELIFAHYRSDSSYAVSSYVYWGSASGYSSSDLTALYAPGALAVEVEDLNGDGWLDVILACYYSGSSHGTYSYVYWGSVTGPDSTNYDALYTYGARHVGAGDLDGDGYTDLVFPSYYSGSSYSSYNSIYWGNSGGYSAADRDYLASYGAWDVVIEDYDLDGWDDLFFTQYYSGSTYSYSSYLYGGSAAGYSSSDLTGLATTGATNASSADVDEDGWPDLIVSCYRSSSSFEIDSYVYYGSAAGFSSTDRDDLPVDGAWGEAVVVGL